MTTTRAQILADIDAERDRQNAIHPDSGDMPDGTSPNWASMRESMRETCNAAARRGGCSFLDVLLEEAYEAASETDPEKLRRELVQVAAVAVRWMERLDRDATVKRAQWKQRREMHKAFDHLLAEYLMDKGTAMPSTTTVIELLQWSRARLGAP